MPSPPVMVAHVPSCPPAHADSPETGLYCRVMSTSHTKDGGGEFCCGTSTPLTSLPPHFCWSSPSRSGPSLLPPLSSGHAPLPLAGRSRLAPGPWRVLAAALLYLLSVCTCPEGGRRTSLRCGSPR